MRLLPLFKKTMIENFRDWKILILGLTFAPFFVVLMYYYFGEATESYQVVFVNHDLGAVAADGTAFNAGEVLISEVEKFKYPDGTKPLNVFLEKDVTKAQKLLKNKSADLIVEIPEDFSKTLLNYKEGKRQPPAVVKTHGDPANPKYFMAAAWCDFLAYQYTMTIGCFPFFILMFFSGGMFPIPTIQIFSLGSRPININDILPTTHSINAFGKILNHGAGLGDLIFETGAIVLLSVLYFAAGISLFTRRHMRPG